MKNWYETQYPIGTEVEVAGEGEGFVQNYFDNSRVNGEVGIVVRLDEGGYTEIPTGELFEDGRPGIVTKL